jgi:hypothetical protein
VNSNLYRCSVVALVCRGPRAPDTCPARFHSWYLEISQRALPLACWQAAPSIQTEILKADYISSKRRGGFVDLSTLALLNR